MNLKHLIRPKTIAVVGASREETKIGHMVLKDILEAGFPRDSVFPVNPNVNSILGLKCYPTVKDIPAHVEPHPYTIEEAKAMLRRGNPIIVDALEEGKVLYSTPELEELIEEYRRLKEAGLRRTKTSIVLPD